MNLLAQAIVCHSFGPPWMRIAPRLCLSSSPVSDATSAIVKIMPSNPPFVSHSVCPVRKKFLTFFNETPLSVHTRCVPSLNRPKRYRFWSNWRRRVVPIVSAVGVETYWRENWWRSTGTSRWSLDVEDILVPSVKRRVDLNFFALETFIFVSSVITFFLLPCRKWIFHSLERISGRLDESSVYNERRPAGVNRNDERRLFKTATMPSMTAVKEWN